MKHASGHGVAESAQLSISRTILARTTSDTVHSTAAAERAVQLVRRAPEPFTFGYVSALVGNVACENDDPIGLELLREARQALNRCADGGIVGAAPARTEACSRVLRPRRPIAG